MSQSTTSKTTGLGKHVPGLKQVSRLEYLPSAIASKHKPDFTGRLTRVGIGELVEPDCEVIQKVD
jgi:ribosomal protein L20A (L18A)